jgi:hypothetical protein
MRSVHGVRLHERFFARGAHQPHDSAAVQQWTLHTHDDATAGTTAGRILRIDDALSNTLIEVVWQGGALLRVESIALAHVKPVRALEVVADGAAWPWLDVPVWWGLLAVQSPPPYIIIDGQTHALTVTANASPPPIALNATAQGQTVQAGAWAAQVWTNAHGIALCALCGGRVWALRDYAQRR